ncbi:glycosyltransferase [Nesterenkonia sp. CF4.4]|uniref:glycosyltransferase n=1 Tax=Nesterenkonia sp. CF4.4 TaxID=3373079 RepID=UPI003EE666C7
MSITVASVPASHVYIRHLSHPQHDPAPLSDAPRGHTRGHTRGAAPVLRLPDPPSARKDTPTGAPWWPPAMLDPAWIAAHEFDLMHVHFGFDAQTPEQLHEVFDALDARGRPLIYTAHDLWNPHQEDPTLHDSQLEVLFARARAVITLSEQAAEEIRERWGVQAQVIPHPHVVDLDLIRGYAEAPRRRDEEFRLGVHLKSLRANIVGVEVLQAALAALREIPGSVLQVDLHRDVFEAAGPRHDAELVRWLQAQDIDLVDLRVHDYYTDAELFDYLAGLHTSLLPYRFGTHSGWMEAAHDLGTTVIAPDVGCYRSQGADFLYRWQDGGLDAASLRRAVHAAAAQALAVQASPAPASAASASAAPAATPPGHPQRATTADPGAKPWLTQAAAARVGWRREQRRQIAAAHAEVYARALSGS